jgi:hypothetical protein
MTLKLPICVLLGHQTHIHICLLQRQSNRLPLSHNTFQVHLQPIDRLALFLNPLQMLIQITLQPTNLTCVINEKLIINYSTEIIYSIALRE